MHVKEIYQYYAPYKAVFFFCDLVCAAIIAPGIWLFLDFTDNLRGRCLWKMRLQLCVI